MPTFAAHLRESDSPDAMNKLYMVAVVQLVRASDCGSECRGFESHLPPGKKLSPSL